MKIQFLGQDRGLTFLHNPIFDDILTTPYPFKRYMCFSCFLLCPFPFQFFMAGPIAMTIPHFKVAKGSKGITTSLFCLNNRMTQKILICHLFARTVKCCVDTELFLVKMQKKCQISPTLANWPLAWLAGATQGRLKNSPIFSFPLFPLSSFTKFSPNSSCSAVSRFPEER